MKNILVMTATAVGLFCATIAGLLSVQGRLNYEGTKGIPVLNSFFSPPLESEEDKKEGAEGDKGQAKGDHAKPKGDQHGGAGEKLHDSKAHAKPEGPIIEVGIGESIKKPAAEKSSGGHGEPEADGHAEETHDTKKPRRTPGKPGVDRKKREQDRMLSEFERRKEWLKDLESRYRAPGDLFKMPRIEVSGKVMSVDEVNALIERSVQMQKDVEMQKAVLARTRRDLEVRERDIADRQTRVQKMMGRVRDERLKIEQTINDFNRRVVELRVDEEAAMRETAKTIASLNAEQARDLILDYWRTEAGQSKAVKILAVMEKEKVDAIVGQMETAQMREILEKRMTLSRSGKKK